MGGGDSNYSMFIMRKVLQEFLCFQKMHEVRKDRKQIHRGIIFDLKNGLRENISEWMENQFRILRSSCSHIPPNLLVCDLHVCKTQAIQGTWATCTTISASGDNF
ncbi:hypothetical protein CHS0354_037304 [Potamilus streckersoni]|uniref:Uncharacterized protein n=1 Tax=Potamilus streckersoni TaxID=2493646 RepID=A0AAE0TKS5_9BIVA|nr:hypothetical protein CHS0354_037304 [Potamilus streckersoni]